MKILGVWRCFVLLAGKEQGARSNAKRGRGGGGGGIHGEDRELLTSTRYQVICFESQRVRGSTRTTDSKWHRCDKIYSGCIYRYNFSITYYTSVIQGCIMR